MDCLRCTGSDGIFVGRNGLSLTVGIVDTTVVEEEEDEEEEEVTIFDGEIEEEEEILAVDISVILSLIHR